MIDTNKMRQVAGSLSFADANVDVQAAKYLLIDGSVTIDELIRAKAALQAVVEALIDELPEIPDPCCSCHISPPCHDCVNWASMREVVADAKALL
jgi:hypothetical protein